MAVNLSAPTRLAPIAGAEWAVGEAAIKKPGRNDMAVLKLADTATVAGVFTQNAFAAAPVRVAQRHSASGRVRALLINSGNANAGTGRRGEADALACCESVAAALSIEADEVLPFSTGVIGQHLPVERMQACIATLGARLTSDNWLDAAQAIMTTDTVPKGATRSVDIGDDTCVTLTGISKGSGMIRPDMATMLAFIATDAAIDADALDKALRAAMQGSFNAISVDGDTSTNDACIACATGTGATLAPTSPGWSAFVDALTDLARELAQAIVRDGEGATRFITLDVTGARDVDEARAVAFTVAHSPLVKTACFAGDPNWGRILAAVGRAPVQAFSIDRVAIALDDVAIVSDGEPRDDYAEVDAAAVMGQSEYTINIDLGRGDTSARIWTSDLSYEYVRINAEYRS
ncbi:Arginine biosynthesis bifunctional protein ArgJ [Salinisphaera shabanensis E1L3A]|uniref:Arginine biosynthesis bifunctional protein ArgJ n=1 Tax=Salinisphaera shabanensis E1L3A TaxID=1033802 RepID=U2FYR0_9GAMM|nr:bifunctional glutamate N-acetyltransferase/amino-acid acetyltransferase ArgJ [Salinisphaera shabanensis]ERJ20934.1 Arginine biosynthesis bifunctional protein ArgJ [Salinisphaera shabanensis E1L3A]